jgi:hypothetical protein
LNNDIDNNARAKIECDDDDDDAIGVISVEDRGKKGIGF